MRSRTIFLLAVVMGIITTALLVVNLQQEDVAGEEQVQMVEVVIAAETIQQNQRISQEMVMTTEIPREQAHEAVFRRVEDVEGTFATAMVVEGEIILTHRIKAEKEEADMVSRKVQDGQRALSIGVDFVRSVSNLIEPEDYVDVLYTVWSDDNEEAETEIILTNVRVLAVGRKMIETSDGEAHVEYSSVTLEVSSNESISIVNAYETGSIHMSLHSRLTSEERSNEVGQ